MIFPSLPPSGQAYALIMGDRVTATIPEIITAMASVNANSLNNAPVSPVSKPMGAYTAAKVTVILMIGANSCLELAKAACILPIPDRM